MLWLACHFPFLSLEALPLRRTPSAVAGRGRILACDPAAAEAGIAPGQKLSTALGLLPALAVFARDPASEARALHDLACWAGRFTPTVVCRPPAMLLLEIGGCLRLFGGARAIVEAALAGLAEQGWRVCWAAAPTPQAADWLARSDSRQVLAGPAELHAALGALSCRVPDWPAEVRRRLESYGLSRLADVRALPGASLRQRLGNGPVDDLLRAWGEVPDPQTPFVFPETFVRRLELPARVEHAEGLAFAGQRLFAALLGWLDARQLLLRACTLRLEHDDGTTAALALAFGEPAAEEGRFLRLLREHLSRLQLAAPVEALALAADDVVARPGASLALFDAPPAGEGTAACLERLQARLGEAAVRVLAAPADHRPECASGEAALRPQAAAGRLSPGGEARRRDAADGKAAPAPASGVQPGADSPPDGSWLARHAAHRPYWLLPTPQPLAERDGMPRWHGPLQLLSRGERLESGWWDSGEPERAGDVRRDYFVARNPAGQWAWIYRDAGGWFLHGLFA